MAEARLRDARTLFRSGRLDGAYYLSGYVVENALKACIAKQTRRFEFPDRSRVNASYTHKLDQLLGVAGLRDDLDASAAANRALGVNWNIVRDWSEESRYETYSRQEVEDLLNAIADPSDGV
ncbi:MAG: HEPN domain-containing protein, partial [Chloroflexi bacterium]|nr:HEPN domain-containing protein [Chloroflexota bacterium]